MSQNRKKKIYESYAFDLQVKRRIKNENLIIKKARKFSNSNVFKDKVNHIVKYYFAKNCQKFNFQNLSLQKQHQCRPVQFQYSNYPNQCRLLYLSQWLKATVVRRTNYPSLFQQFSQQTVKNCEKLA